MAERSLAQLVAQLKQSPSMSYPEANALLSKAKLALLSLKALTPSPSVPQNLLALAREIYEQGALFAIRARKPEAFTRYVQQLQPFYELPSSRLPPNLAERNRVTGLSLLLLLTQGRYAEFHSELESLANREGGGGDVEGDRYLGYPIRLERWLMEGSYDRVWKAMKSSEVPCDEYSVFSEVSFSTLIMCVQPVRYADIYADSQEPDSLGNCKQQRACVPKPAHQLHQIPFVSRLRR
jgi:26S proteasome regulatory subunit N12